MSVVEPGSPAAQAGLAPGDIVVAVDGEVVTGVDDVLRLLDSERIGRETAVAALRGGRLREVRVVPTERVAKIG